MAPPPETREEILAGWVLKKEGSYLMLWRVPGGASPSECGSEGVLRVSQSSHLEDLALFMDLYFLVEHLNLMLFILALVSHYP